MKKNLGQTFEKQCFFKGDMQKAKAYRIFIQSSKRTARVYWLFVGTVRTVQLPVANFSYCNALPIRTSVLAAFAGI